MENASPLAAYLFGKTRTAALAALLLRPEQKLHVRELARLAHISPGTLHRELSALASLGILQRETVGRQVFYSADRDCPVFDELAGLLRKTAGLVDVVRAALQSQAPRIRAAFIYGSMASVRETSGSDVDVMIVGDLTFGDAVVALEPAQTSLGREVNALVMRLDDFLRKRRASEGFVARVWAEPKLWVIGSARELGEPRQDRATEAPPRRRR